MSLEQNLKQSLTIASETETEALGLKIAAALELSLIHI